MNSIEFAGKWSDYGFVIVRRKRVLLVRLSYVMLTSEILSRVHTAKYRDDGSKVKLSVTI